MTVRLVCMQSHLLELSLSLEWIAIIVSHLTAFLVCPNYGVPFYA